MRFLKNSNCLLLFSFILLVLFFTNSKNRSNNEEPKNKLPLYVQKYQINQSNMEIKKLDIKKLKVLLKMLNCKQSVTNGNKFSSINNDSPILIIQVHTDLEKLQYLILSLSQVDSIKNSLIIFSHSFYCSKINRLIRSIDFCKVMQIFYPYSLQLHPNEFPGVDPNDCNSYKRRIKNAQKLSHCAKRDASITEHKQHWWWKANFVFEHVRLIRKHTGPFIFLDENNYVAPDLLIMFHCALETFNYFSHIEVLSFGGPLNVINLNLLSVEPWRPPFDLGLAFNKTTWRKIFSYSSHYCMFDDSSWSYSMWNLFGNFPKGYVTMARFMTPRVLNTKEIVHSEQKFKEYVGGFNTLNVFCKKLKAVFLFGPEGVVERAHKCPPKGDGAWNDLRDQLLCLDPLMSTTTE